MSEKKRSIGGIWKKAGQWGEWWSGQIEIAGQKYNFTASPNRYKESGDRKPDFQIYPSEPRKAETNVIVEDDLPF